MMRGYYVARGGEGGGTIVAYDWFEIRRGETEMVVESRHEQLIPVRLEQKARFEMELDWTPKRLTVQVPEDDLSCCVIFRDESVTLSLCRGGAEEETVVSEVPRKSAIFLLNGGLYFPLLAVQRFRREGMMPTRFNIIPDGTCELKQVGGRESRTVEMAVAVQGHREVFGIQTDAEGTVLSYTTLSSNLHVTLESELPDA